MTVCSQGSCGSLILIMYVECTSYIHVCMYLLMVYHYDCPLACVYPAIQHKGCLVVRLLSSVEHLTSQPLCLSLASAVVGALSQWRTEPEVEVEVQGHRHTHAHM